MKGNRSSEQQIVRILHGAEAGLADTLILYLYVALQSRNLTLLAA